MRKSQVKLESNKEPISYTKQKYDLGRENRIHAVQSNRKTE